MIYVCLATVAYMFTLEECMCSVFTEEHIFLMLTQTSVWLNKLANPTLLWATLSSPCSGQEPINQQ